MLIVLNSQELAELDRQNPITEGDGGYQKLLVSLQRKVNRATGGLQLTARDMERIQRYAFDYKRGGWQERLQRIFGRNLGPMLGRKIAA